MLAVGLRHLATYLAFSKLMVGVVSFDGLDRSHFGRHALLFYQHSLSQAVQFDDCFSFLWVRTKTTCALFLGCASQKDGLHSCNSCCEKPSKLLANFDRFAPQDYSSSSRSTHAHQPTQTLPLRLHPSHCQSHFEAGLLPTASTAYCYCSCLQQ